MWSPKGQQVMIPTPGQPKTQYGLGAVNYHTGETVVLTPRWKRRREVTHCALFQTVKALIEAAYDFFARYNRCPEQVLSITGAH